MRLRVRQAPRTLEAEITVGLSRRVQTIPEPILAYGHPIKKIPHGCRPELVPVPNKVYRQKQFCILRCVEYVQEEVKLYILEDNLYNVQNYQLYVI